MAHPVCPLHGRRAEISLSFPLCFIATCTYHCSLRRRFLGKSILLRFLLRENIDIYPLQRFYRFVRSRLPAAFAYYSSWWWKSHLLLLVVAAKYYVYTFYPANRSFFFHLNFTIFSLSLVYISYKSIHNYFVSHFWC